MDNRFDLLERKYAMFILNELGKLNDGESLSKKELQHRGGDEDTRTKLSRINEMIEAELIEVDKGNNKYNISKLSLTEKGKKIAKILSILEDLLPDEEIKRRY